MKKTTFSALVHTGAGRNQIKLAKGNDMLHTGPGINHVQTGSGNTVFAPAYGGVTIVSQWRKGQIYDLNLWPNRPVLVLQEGTADFTLGLSLLRIYNVPKDADILSQMRWDPPRST